LLAEGGGKSGKGAFGKRKNHLKNTRVKGKASIKERGASSLKRGKKKRGQNRGEKSRRIALDEKRSGERIRVRGMKDTRAKQAVRAYTPNIGKNTRRT